MIFHSWSYFFKRDASSSAPGFWLVFSNQPKLRARLSQILLKEPIFISLAVRWLGWLVALGIIVFQAAPQGNLRNGPWVLAWTALQLTVMSLYPLYLRERYFPTNWTGTLWFPVADISLGVLAVYQTGGWDSPFFHFAVTTVLAPSLRYGLLGAVVSAGAFLSAYLLAIYFSASGFEPALLSNGRPHRGLVSTPFNPLMIGLFAALLGEVLKRLRIEQEKVRVLAASEERARMAREIHDGVSQTLFMLSMSIESGQVLAQKEEAERTGKHLADLVPIARGALTELRNSMYNLTPLAEGEQPLSEAVEQLVRDYRSATGLALEAEKREGFSEPEEHALGIYRMVQESLSNACKHSKASRIQVVLGEPRPPALVIRDDGEGFDTESVSRGRGLGNLERRAQELGVELELKSDENGTEVLIDWGNK